MPTEKEMKNVYSVTEGNVRTYWTRIGTAFVNKDGSLNVVLHTLPENGKMHICDIRGSADPEIPY